MTDKDWIQFFALVHKIGSIQTDEPLTREDVVSLFREKMVEMNAEVETVELSALIDEVDP